MEDYYIFFVAECYLSAIINDDYSGIEDDAERMKVSDFIVECHRLGRGHFSVDLEYSENFRRCYISGLFADCEELRYYVRSKA
jgi:hypothetical protein